MRFCSDKYHEQGHVPRSVTRRSQVPETARSLVACKGCYTSGKRLLCSGRQSPIHLLGVAPHTVTSLPGNPADLEIFWNSECATATHFPSPRATTDKTKMAPHPKSGKSGPKGHPKHPKKEDKILKRKREAEDHDRLKKAIDELVCIPLPRPLSRTVSPSILTDDAFRTPSPQPQTSPTCPSAKPQSPA